MSVCYRALKRAFEQLSRVAPTRTPSLNYLRFLSFYLTFSRATRSTRSKPVADKEAYRTLHRGFSNQVCQVKDLEKPREITWEQVRHRQPRTGEDC